MTTSSINSADPGVQAMHAGGVHQFLQGGFTAHLQRDSQTKVFAQCDMTCIFQRDQVVSISDIILYLAVNMAKSHCNLVYKFVGSNKRHLIITSMQNV